MYINCKMQRKVDVGLFVNTKVSLLMIAIAMCLPVWALDKEHLVREGGMYTVSLVQKDGLVSAVKLSMQCLGQVRLGQQLPHFCLGVETASMLMLSKGGARATDKGLLTWFDGEAMTGRVLTYCYSYMGLTGDMQCLEQMAQAKALLMPYALGEPVRTQAMAGAN